MNLKTTTFIIQLCFGDERVQVFDRKNSIVFAAGGLTSGTTQMTIIPNQTVHVEIATESTDELVHAMAVLIPQLSPSNNLSTP